MGEWVGFGTYTLNQFEGEGLNDGGLGVKGYLLWWLIRKRFGGFLHCRIKD